MNLGRNSSVGNFNIREQLSIGSCQISKQEDVSDRFPLFSKTSVSKQDTFLAVGSDLETSELKSHTSDITHFEYNVFSSHAPYNTPPGAYGEVVLKLQTFDSSVLSVGFNCSITSGSKYWVGNYYIVSHVDEANEKVTLAFLYNSLTDEQANTFPDAISYGEVNGYTFQIFSKTTYNLVTNELTCQNLNTTTSTHENLRVETITLESNGHPDTTISNYEGKLAVHPNLTVPYDITAGSLYLGKNMNLSGSISSTTLKLKSDGFSDAVIDNHEGRVNVVDLRSANLVVANGKVETPEIRLFNSDGSPDAYISNYSGRVNVQDLGASNEIVANNTIVTPKVTLKSDGFSDVVIDNHGGVVGVVDLRSANLVVAEGKVETPEIRLFNSDGSPDAYISNYSGRVNVQDLGASNEIVANNTIVTPKVTLKSDGFSDAIIDNHDGIVGVVDLRSANLVVAEGKLEAPQIRLFNTDGSPDAYISNASGHVRVESLQIGDVNLSTDDSGFVISKNFDLQLEEVQQIGYGLSVKYAQNSTLLNYVIPSNVFFLKDGNLDASQFFVGVNIGFLLNTPLQIQSIDMQKQAHNPFVHIRQLFRIRFVFPFSRIVFFICS